MRSSLTVFCLAAMAAPAFADGPPPVPLTRAEMKRMMEESKLDRPRLSATPSANADISVSLRGTAAVQMLLPKELRDGFSFFMTDGRLMEMSKFALRNPAITESPTAPSARGPKVERDPNMTMEWAYRTMIFWVVSRSNNCIYCMGHQESSLPAVGVTEDRIAALDGDWSEFTLAERAAFALARKMTVAPHTIVDADIEAVRRHYADLQVLEMTGLVAGFNAMNRWTGPLRLTQEGFREFLTPTSSKYASIVTKVGPVPGGVVGARCAPAAMDRPALEPRSEVEAKWDECRARKARFPLVDPSAVRAILAEGTLPADRPVPNWVRLLLNFPKAGPAKVSTLSLSRTKGAVPAKLKAQLAWVSARADRSWYALAEARDRLRALGASDDAIFGIDTASEGEFTPAERAAFAFARKLTIDPARIDDADFDAMKAHYSDALIAEILFHTNHSIFFNLLTETAGLPLDDAPDKAVSSPASGGQG
ncbi:hypothetical protein EP7_003335 [Isosphaeraceae bacterium EP7]